MDNVLIGISNIFSKVPILLLRIKIRVLFFVSMISVLMLVGIVQRTSLDMSMEGYLQKDDPAIKALNSFREQFGSDDSVYLAYRARDGDAFSAGSLSAVQSLTEDLISWRALDVTSYKVNGAAVSSFDSLHHIHRVRSLANIRVQSADEDSLHSNLLVDSVLPKNEEDINVLRKKALDQSDYKLVFYSLDGEYAAISIETDFGTQLEDDFVADVDAEGVRLDDSFTTLSSAIDADLGFDALAQVQKKDFLEPDMLAYVNFFHELKAVYQPYEKQFEFYPVGNAPTMEFNWRMQQQMTILGVGMIFIFIILLWVLFRSLSAVLWPLLTIALSVIWVWGATSWFGVQISQMISLTVMLIFAVGIADCVHVMSAYTGFLRAGDSHEEALSSAYRKTGLALLVTSITTVVGLLALSVSDLAIINVFAVMSSMGVLLAFVFTVILLPIFLDFWHPSRLSSDKDRRSKFSNWWDRQSPVSKCLVVVVYLSVTSLLLGPAIGSFLTLIPLATYVVIKWQQEILATLPKWVAANRWMVLFIFSGIFSLCAYGVHMVKIDSNIVELYEEDSEIRKSYRVVDENMAGSQSIEIMIDTKQVDGMLNPKMLQAVELLQRRIEETYPQEISRSYSLANIVKETNAVMNGDDARFSKIPDSKSMISQLLYLFNSSNPEERRKMVSDDYSRSHITVNVYNAGSQQYQHFFEEIQEDIEEVFFDVKQTELAELEVTVTGTVALMMKAMGQIAESQYNSFAIALGVISIILVFALGSLQGGLIAVLPNLLPAVVTVGLLGLFGLPLDVDTLLIAPLVIGIAVDDTIHFMTHYRAALIESRSMAVALTRTIRDVGKAVIFTTLILGLGLGLMSFSQHLGVAKVGIFGATAILVALLCDLFFLPALLMVFRPKFGLTGVDKRFIF